MSHVQNALKSMTAELEAIYEDAINLRDKYLEEYDLTYNTRARPIAERPAFVLEVGLNKTTVTISWKKVVFQKMGGKARRFHQHVKLGESLKYSMLKFKGAPTWQKSAIQEFEEKFEPLRTRSQRINNVIRILTKYDEMFSRHQQRHDAAKNSCIK